MREAVSVTSAPAYTLTARVLHWLIAVLVIALIVVGLVMVRLPEGPLQTLLFDLHRAIGWLILPLMLIRLVYRLTHPPAPLPSDIPALQRAAAHISHWLLYIGLIAQPIIGWLGMSTFGEPINVFGLFDVPRIWSKDEALSEQLFVIHIYIGWAIGALVCVHVAAALHHHFVRRDIVLMRMVQG